MFTVRRQSPINAPVFSFRQEQAPNKPMNSRHLLYATATTAMNCRRRSASVSPRSLGRCADNIPSGSFSPSSAAGPRATKNSCRASAVLVTRICLRRPTTKAFSCRRRRRDAPHHGPSEMTVDGEPVGIRAASRCRRPCHVAVVSQSKAPASNVTCESSVAPTFTRKLSLTQPMKADR